MDTSRRPITALWEADARIPGGFRNQVTVSRPITAFGMAGPRIPGGYPPERRARTHEAGAPPGMRLIARLSVTTIVTTAVDD